jgi:hypothetical protein
VWYNNCAGAKLDEADLHISAAILGHPHRFFSLDVHRSPSMQLQMDYSKCIVSKRYHPLQLEQGVDCGEATLGAHKVRSQRRCPRMTGSMTNIDTIAL